MANTFEATIYLSNFIGSRTIVQEDENGNQEVGIFIPAERNALVRTDRDKWLTWGFIQEMDFPDKGFTHWIRQKTNPAFLRATRERDELPTLIAKLKPTKFYRRKPKFVDKRVRLDYGDEL